MSCVGNNILDAQEGRKRELAMSGKPAPVVSFLLGIGVWMLNAFWQLASSLYPEKFKPHPSVLWITGISGTAFLLIGGILWARNHWASAKLSETTAGNRVSDHSQATKGSYAGRDMLGIGSITAGRDVILPGSPTGTPPVQLPTPKPIELPKPNLTSLRVVELPRPAYGTGIFWGDGRPQPIYIVEIENALRDVPIANAQSVQARIDFKNTRTNQIVGRVQHAYWKDHGGYEITIKSGHVESLVLGKAVGSNWHSYENEVQFPPDFHGSVISGLLPKESVIDLDEGDLEATVTVFTRWPEGIVLLRDVYCISFPGTIPIVQKLI
jgi:hypothetical protein